jgi:hypothetical protein
MDILYLLDRLEDLVSGARRVPLSSQVLVDAQECLDVVDQLRLSLPEELKDARRVLAERERILADAEQTAAHLVQRAEHQAAARVDDHALVQAAEQRARALVDRAEADASEIQRQADDYAYRVMASLQRRLGQLQEVVQQGLIDLRADRS